MNTEELNAYASREYKRSRGAYIAECTFEYFVSLLVTDAYLANLLRYMGISDGMIGIISSLISFAFLFQLIAIIAVKHIVNVKRASIIFHFTSQLFFLSIFLVPFLPIPTQYKTAVVIVCVLLAYFGNYLVSPVIFKWGMTYVDTHKRSSFGATKEMVSLVGGVVFTLAVGFVLDRFNESGNVSGGFVFLAAGILLCSIVDLICLLLMKNTKAEKAEDRGESIFSVAKKLFKNKAFLCLLVVGALMYGSMYFIIGFMGAYKTDDLGFTVGQVQIINTVGILFRFAISKPFGKLSDRTSYATGLLIGFSILAFAFMLNMFTAPSTRWLLIPYSLLYNGSMALIMQNFINITFTYVESKYFVQATSIKAAVSGICGFLASLAGAAILDVVRANGNVVLGINLRAQQLLSAISFVLVMLLIAFIVFVLKKQKKTEE